MEIRDWQEFGAAVGQPLSAREPLAFGAMPVAAGIRDVKAGNIRFVNVMAAPRPRVEVLRDSGALLTLFKPTWPPEQTSGLR
jgi:hypothetical protein